MPFDLKQLNVRQLALLGDAALRGGDHALAQRFYATLRERAPKEPHVLARVGIGQTLTGRASYLLDILEFVEKSRPAVFLSEGLCTWNKTLPFLDDPRFLELADRHANLLPVKNWHWNLQTIVWAVRQVERVDGDFVELGVFRGHTTLFVSEYVQFADWPKSWWLYDTFAGIPEDQLDPGWAERNTNAYADTFSHEEVSARFAHIPNVKVVKGRVPEILDQGSPEKIAFLHVDLNNAVAEIQALEVLFDRITPGGVIVFDDYVWRTARAQYDAEKAWFEARGLTILPLPTGQGVFVKR